MTNGSAANESARGKFDRLRVSCYLSGMRRTTPILFAVLLAMLVRPLQLPAASCILSNAPSAEGCKPHCCANKSCCATSKKSTTPLSQPLAKAGEPTQLQVISVVSVSFIDSLWTAARLQPARENIPGRAHSPPLLATTCIRLI